MARSSRSAGTTSPLVVALTCAVGVGCVMYDQTSLVVSAPTIAEDFGTDISGLQWIVAIFSLVAASTMPISGLLGKRWGARTTLQVGLATLLVGGLISSVSPSLLVLLGGRVVQGVGGALILPNAATLLGGNIADPEVRTRSVGHWMTASSTALLLGPLLGGILAENWGWRATFLVYLPVAALAIVLVGRLDNTPRERAGRVDLLGLSVASMILGLLSWALIDSGSQDPTWNLVTLGFIAAGVLVTLFTVIERRVSNPMLDFDVFRNRVVALVLIAAFTYNAAINGTAILISVYFQDSRGFGASIAGILLLVTNAGMPLAGILVGRLHRVFTGGSLMTIGVLILGGAYLALWLLSTYPLWVLVLPLLSVGLGAGILYYVDTSTVLAHISGPSSASAMAALALMRQIGSVLGIAAMASIGQLGVALGLGGSSATTAFLLSAIMLTVMGAAGLGMLHRRRARR